MSTSIPNTMLLPTYHLIAPENSEFAYSTSESRLREQFELLNELSRVNGSPRPCVSFDDGHASHYRHAFPILERYRVEAIFFVVAGWAGVRCDYMTWPQLRELAAAGYQIQSHGLTHRFLTQCTGAELAHELRVSKIELEQRLGISVDAISIPFGRWNDRVLIACSDAGYTRVYTSDPQRAPARDGRCATLGRFMVRRSTTLNELRRIVVCDDKTLLALQTRHEWKLRLRRAVGEEIYHRVWGILASRRALHEARAEY
jgi:peptidoglycan/xylan/chitin deacetylase (PgdA/CDA1 family)